MVSVKMTMAPKTEIQQYSRELAAYTLHQFALARSLQGRAPKSSSTHTDNSRDTKAPGVHRHSED